jgi:broad specificity phosphatase PhoE
MFAYREDGPLRGGRAAPEEEDDARARQDHEAARDGDRELGEDGEGACSGHGTMIGRDPWRKAGGSLASLVLVRHAMPDMTDDHADTWHLGPSGRAAARRLAATLPRNALVVTSDEAKARETAEEVVAARGGTIRVDARVAEAARPFEWSEDYRERARRYVSGTNHTGWEPHDEVVRRFDAAVREAFEVAGSSPLVLVDHGLAMTLWLHGAGAIEDAGAFWDALAFPDAWDVSLRGGRAAASRRSASATLPWRS